MGDLTWVMFDGALRAHRLVPVTGTDIGRLACGRSISPERVDVTEHVVAGTLPACQRCEPRPVELTPAQVYELSFAVRDEGLVRGRIHRTTREHLEGKGLVEHRVGIGWRLTDLGWTEARRRGLGK